MSVRPPAPIAPPASRARLIAALLVAIVLVALAIAWTATPLRTLFDAQRVAAYEQQARQWPLAPLVVIAAHVVSGLIAAPATLMIGATVLLFGAWPGSLYALVGMLLNGTLVYAIGRFAGRDFVDRWLAARAGSRLDLLNRQLVRRGFVAVALIRLTPFPFTLQNLVAGASGIRFVHFVFGTAIGILPPIALVAGVVTEFDAWLDHPDWRRLLALVVAAVVAVAVGWALKRWATRRTSGR